MIKIAVTIVHNKTPEENEQQIVDLLALLTEQEEYIDGVDDKGNTIPNAFVRYFYTFNDLDFPHEVDIYQVVPYQPDNTSSPYKAILPSNFYAIKGRNVQYGKGDEDKTGNHPRFFNWALKRGTDNGAEAAVVLEDVQQLDTEALAVSLNSLADPKDKHELVEDATMKVASLKLLKEVGQLDEKKPMSQAVSDLKTRVSKGGLKTG